MAALTQERHRPRPRRSPISPEPLPRQYRFHLLSGSRKRTASVRQLRPWMSVYTPSSPHLRAPILNVGNAMTSPVMFTIAKASPTIVGTAAGGTFNGKPFPATATATGINGAHDCGHNTVHVLQGQCREWGRVDDRADQRRHLYCRRLNLPAAIPTTVTHRAFLSLSQSQRQFQRSQPPQQVAPSREVRFLPQRKSAGISGTTIPRYDDIHILHRHHRERDGIANAPINSELTLSSRCSRAPMRTTRM